MKIIEIIEIYNGVKLELVHTFVMLVFKSLPIFKKTYFQLQLWLIFSIDFDFIFTCMDLNKCM